MIEQTSTIFNFNMKHSTIVKILTGVGISEEELTEFIVSYILIFKFIEPSSEELSSIIHYIKTGRFNLQFAAIQAAPFSDKTVNFLHNPKGTLIKIF